MAACENCGDEIAPLNLDTSIVSPAGWCVPEGVEYELTEPLMCSDCKSRLMFISEIGFDPGKDGENLRVPRGGIQFRRSEPDA